MATPPAGGPAEFTLPDALPVLPLPDGVVFPLTAVPLLVVNPAAVRVIDDVHIDDAEGADASGGQVQRGR